MGGVCKTNLTLTISTQTKNYRGVGLNHIHVGTVWNFMFNMSLTPSPIAGMVMDSKTIPKASFIFSGESCFLETALNDGSLMKFIMSI